MEKKNIMGFFKKSRIRTASFVAGSLVLVLSYQNCSNSFVNSSGLSSGITEQDIMQQKAMQVLTTRCSSCHNADLKSGGVDVLSVNDMLALGIVIPGEPSLSLVFTQIQNGSMPPSKPLAQAEVDAVFSWISEGFKDSTPVITPPPPTPTTLEPKYASIYTKILQPKCLGCHNSGSSNGVSFSSYNATMNTVQKTLPLSSALYTAVATRRTMPKGAPGSLSAAETKAIFDWITAGAANN